MSKSLLSSLWQTSLPSSGYQVVSTLKSAGNLYAASNGYIYRLDPVTGAVLSSNGLSGRGYNEIRIAMSSDQSMLLAGTNGYAIGLDPVTLDTKWQTSLPDCGYHVVSVASGTNGAYFGSDGYVYLLDVSNGTVQKQNSLAGGGYEEVRLTVNDDENIVFAGTNGYVYGLKNTDISTNWSTSLPGCGYNIVSVESGSNVVFAGSNGYVYRVNSSNGAVLQTNDLPDRGSYEVRLSLNQDETLLTIGTNGYLIGLDPANVGTNWQTSLPGSGFNIVTPLAFDQVCYAGSDGLVYELDANSGAINATNGLSGMGNHEIRLADDDDDEILWVGTNGYMLGLSLEGYVSVDGPWMSKLTDTMKLRNVAIPGTHDSGTYGITPISPIGEDLPWYIPYITATAKGLGINPDPIIAMWSIAQGADFEQQLNAGIRYLDLRLQNNGGSLNFVHGMVSSPLSDLTDQVSAFYNQSGYDKEILFLDFQHVFNMDDSSTDALMTQLKNTFGDKLIAPSTTTNVTLNDLWSGDGRIIVFYEDDSVVANYDFLWSRSNLDDVWPDVQTAADLKNSLDKQLPYKGDNFFVLQGILTPDGGTIASGFIPFSGNPMSLLDQAKELNPQLNSWINNDWSNSGVNIVICDWFQISNFVDVVVGLNSPTNQLERLKPRKADIENQVQSKLAEIDKLRS